MREGARAAGDTLPPGEAGWEAGGASVFVSIEQNSHFYQYNRPRLDPQNSPACNLKPSSTQSNYKRDGCVCAHSTNPTACTALESNSPLWTCAFYHSEQEVADTAAAVGRLAPTLKLPPVRVPAEQAAALVAAGKAARGARPSADGSAGGAGGGAAGAAGGGWGWGAGGEASTSTNPAAAAAARTLGNAGSGEFPSLSRGAAGATATTAAAAASAAAAAAPALAPAGAGGDAAAAAAADGGFEAFGHDVMRFLFFGPDDGSVGELDWYYLDPERNMHVSCWFV